MLCVVQHNLIDADLAHDISPSSGNCLIFGARTGTVADTWYVLGQEGAYSIQQVWQEQLKVTPEHNQVVVFWDFPDDALDELLGFIHRHQQDYPVSVSLVLAGPLNQVAALDKLLSLQEWGTEDRWVNTIWYVGNENINRDPISREERYRVIQMLLSALLAGDEQLADRLRLFPASRHAPFTAFGLQSWSAPLGIAKQAVSGLIQQLERNEFAKNAMSAKTAEVCRNEASSLFGKLRDLNTPYQKEGPSTGSPFPTRLSLPPNNPFHKWVPPLLRELSIAKGKGKISSQRLLTNPYYFTLVAELRELGTEVRDNGQKIFEMVCDACRNFVRHDTSYPGILATLDSYFPAIRSHQVRGASGTCEPDSSPSLVDCHQWFVNDAEIELERCCGRLPTIRRAMQIGVICLLLVIISCALIGFTHLPLWASLSPALIAGLLAIGFIVVAAWRARRASVQMASFFDAQYRKLRESYMAKIEWVVNNTHTTIERQIISRLSGIGYRLHRNVQDLFDQPPPSLKGYRLEELLSMARLEKDDVAAMQSAIRQSGTALIDDALQDAPPISGKQKATELRQQLVREVKHRTRNKVLEFDSSIASQVENCLKRQHPPILARLNSAQLQDDKIFKVFALPHSYPPCEASLASRARQVGLEVWFWRGQVRAPVVITARSHLSADEMQVTLDVTEVK